MYIDAHCHLEKKYYKDTVDEVVQRAFDADLTHIVAVGASHLMAGADEVLELSDRHENVFAAIGLHPHEASKTSPENVERLKELLSHPKVVALGEIGLDYHYDFAEVEDQKHYFEIQLKIAKELNIPIMLHVREAHDDAIAMVKEVGLPESGGVVHCFTGNKDEALRWVELGLHISISGIVTFKNAEDLQEAVRAIPMERILIETDAPFLSPGPRRGKKNEPAFVIHTAETVGELKGLSGPDVGRIARQNTIDLLNLPTMK